MTTRARLAPSSPQRQQEPPRPAARSALVARSPRAARDPQFMRVVDRLQWSRRSAAVDPAAMAPAASRGVANDARFGAMLEVRPRLSSAALRVSSPQDPAEHEAEATARKVVAMSSTTPVIAAAAPVARTISVQHAARVHTGGRGEVAGHASGGVMAEITAAGPLGRPLPTHVRQFMEPRFAADFRGVRIHTGEQAAQLSRRLRAQAFTVGNQIFFGRDRFRPDSHEGRHLIAHELTHTIQQGAVPQSTPVGRATDVNLDSGAPPGVQRFGLDTILDGLADLANNIPGYRMFSIVLGVNPINMSPVERSAANILRAVVEFLPGGGLITEALDKYGIFDRVGGWIEGQLDALGLSGASLQRSLLDFLDSLGWSDLLHPAAVFDRAKAIFTSPVERIIAFVKSLGAQVLKFVKEAVLRPLADLAAQTPAWDLLTAVLGRNPITGDPVPRTAEALIGGFMKLIGQEELWENLKRAHAVPRAWAWFQGALGGLVGFVQQIPSLLLQAFESLQIADLVLLPRAFAKIGRAFAGFFGRFVSWAGQTVWDLLEIIFAVAAPGVLVYLKRAAAAFKTILKSPIGFVRNLVAAGKLGLWRFVHNFVPHLKAALIGWLTGALGGAGVYIPQALSLLEIGKFVLSVLGITWAKIRGKIVKIIGEPAMKALETGLDIVVALVRGGPAAAWELIKQKLSDLKDMVIESIVSFVKDRIVTAAVTKLVSLLSPAGAFVQAILAIYNTIMFFVERLRQIAAVAATVIDSLAAIAAGRIGPAANKVELTLERLLTVVIGFLARIAGMGRVSDAVVGFIKRVQARVDHALDAAIKWIVEKAKSFLKSVFGKRGKRDTRTDRQMRADLDRAMTEADQLLSNPRYTADEVAARLPAIQARYRLTRLAVVTDSKTEDEEKDHIEGAVNPSGKKPVRKKAAKDGPTKIKLKRATFTATTKWTLYREAPEAHKELIKGRAPRLKAQLDRRHVISSQKMLEHYLSELQARLRSKAKQLLEKRGETVSAQTNQAIQKTAQSRLARFFNDAKNLFIGDAAENRSIGSERDIPADWTARMWRRHLVYIKGAYALSDAFTP